MTTYVAFLRGIMPTNPNMKSARLKQAFETLGFENVKTVIASGNVIFDSGSRSIAALEKKIENGLLEQLGFFSTTIIRSKKEIQDLVETNPFAEADPNLYLVVSFLKNSSRLEIETTNHFQVIGRTDKEVFCAIDTASNQSSNFMQRVDKIYQKQVTTRTWKTVQRVLAKF